MFYDSSDLNNIEFIIICTERVNENTALLRKNIYWTSHLLDIYKSSIPLLATTELFTKAV